MKWLYLIFQRSIQYCKKSKILFALFAVGTIINAIMVCYLYGNLLPAIFNRQSNDIKMYRTYQLGFDSDHSDTTKNYENLNKLITTDLFESVILRSSILISGERVSTIYYGDYPVIYLSGEHRLPQYGEIIIPKLYSSYSSGDCISINDTMFRVVSEHGGDDYFISYDSYREIVDLDIEEEAIPKTRRVNLISRERYIENDDEALKSIEELFPDYFIVRPHGENNDRIGTQHGVIQLLVSFIVSIVSFMFLLVYLLDTGLKENIISRIVGANKITLSSLVFCEGLSLTIIFSSIGILLHLALTPLVFSKLNVIDGILYTKKDYVYISLFIFVLSFVVVFFFTRKYTSISPLKDRRKVN